MKQVAVPNLFKWICCIRRQWVKWEFKTILFRLQKSIFFPLRRNPLDLNLPWLKSGDFEAEGGENIFYSPHMHIQLSSLLFTTR